MVETYIQKRRNNSTWWGGGGGGVGGWRERERVRESLENKQKLTESAFIDTYPTTQLI